MLGFSTPRITGGTTENDGTAGFWNSVGNMITGNQDWKRQNLMQDKQNAFNAYMSNTRYQRATADMKKAGFNPAFFTSNSAFQASAPNSATSSPQNSASSTKSAFGKIAGTRRSYHDAQGNNLKFIMKGLEDLGEAGLVAV